MTGPEARPRRARSAGRATAGYLVGGLLLLAAVWAVGAEGHRAREAWMSVRSAPPALLALALLLPLANWLTVSASFYIVMRRYGPVRAGEMARLIGAAWLLNYLPLRPGLVGRIAYHRAVNHIPIADSVRGLFIGMACGLAAVALVLIVAAALPPGAAPSAWAIGLALPALPLILWILLSLIPPRIAARTPRPLSRARGWLGLNLLLRYLDMLLWLARYWVVFRLTGAPIGVGAAAAVTGAGQIAMAVPFVGNGLGLREWAVGLVARNLPPAYAAAGDVATGLAAELANRAAELCIAVPVGVISYLLLFRGRR